MKKIIDLRSDTFTKPCDAMRKVMANAEVGDDVYGEDPTVKAIEVLGAELAGMEAALFLPTATQSNFCSLLSHCQRGDEYIIGNEGHAYLWEGGGASVLGGIQAATLPFEADGSLDLDEAKYLIKPDDPHFVKTKLLCLENTNSGRVLPMSYLKEAQVFCKEHSLLSHLDGARGFNAAVSLGIPLKEIAQYFDSLSLCLSKGLGAPAGAILCGSGEHIYRARRWRKVLGGGMRQAGILAAAGIYGLENNVERFQEDHEKAELLAEGIRSMESDQVTLLRQDTNMVFVEVSGNALEGLKPHLLEEGIKVGGIHRGSLRLVTHKDMSKEDINTVVEMIRTFVEG